MAAHIPLGYPPNPTYGDSACMRRVTLIGSDGRVDAALADDFHEFSCTVLHDGHCVTGIDSCGIRVPTSICPAASTLLKEMVGLPLQTPAATFHHNGRARRHCTHLYDLAILAIGHARRGHRRRVYEALVPDETNAPVRIDIRLDGQLVHVWTIWNGTILKPKGLAGLPLGKGMAAWASRHFVGDDLEAAILLARTWLIAVGRRYDVNSATGKAITLNSALASSCYAYDAKRASNAVFVASQLGREQSVEGCRDALLGSEPIDVSIAI